MNNAVFTKTSENVRSHRDIKLLTTEARRNYLVSQPRKKFSDKLLAIRVKRTQLHMNKPVYLGLSILEMNKTLMCEFLRSQFMGSQNMEKKQNYVTWKQVSL